MAVAVAKVFYMLQVDLLCGLCVQLPLGEKDGLGNGGNNSWKIEGYVDICKSAMALSSRIQRSVAII